MKIEMGESLIYSWLRHVKDCQIVQTNWKTSPEWTLQHETDLKALMDEIDEHFKKNYGYSIFKGTRSLSQFLRQGECDALGISVQSLNKLYAVDVAFHESGLNYGKINETVMKVVAKTVRTAMSMWGYLDNTDAEIIFASPKIGTKLIKKLQPCIDDVNAVFKRYKLGFVARIIGNEDFNTSILKPMLLLSGEISDTSELFLRSYQLTQLFLSESKTSKHKTHQTMRAMADITDSYKDFKVGKIANIILRGLLESGKASDAEINDMQNADFCKEVFDLQYPVLVKDGVSFDKTRYYALPVTIGKEKFFLCSQWFESSANNDRPYILKWIEEHE